MRQPNGLVRRWRRAKKLKVLSSELRVLSVECCLNSAHALTFWSYGVGGNRKSVCLVCFWIIMDHTDTLDRSSGV